MFIIVNTLFISFNKSLITYPKKKKKKKKVSSLMLVIDWQETRKLQVLARKQGFWVLFWSPVVDLGLEAFSAVNGLSSTLNCFSYLFV